MRIPSTNIFAIASACASSTVCAWTIMSPIVMLCAVDPDPWAWPSAFARASMARGLLSGRCISFGSTIAICFVRDIPPSA